MPTLVSLHGPPDSALKGVLVSPAALARWSTWTTSEHTLSSGKQLLGVTAALCQWGVIPERGT